MNGIDNKEPEVAIPTTAPTIKIDQRLVYLVSDDHQRDDRGCRALWT